VLASLPTSPHALLVSYQVIGLRQFSTGVGPMTFAQAIASGIHAGRRVA